MSILPYAKASTVVTYFPGMGLHNTRLIEDGFLAGGMPDDPIGYETLSLWGADFVINLIGESHEDAAKKAGIRGYLNFPVGEVNPIHLSDMRQVIGTVKVWIRDEKKKGYVHCQWGSDRTGYFICCWRRWVSTWDMDVIRMELAMFASPMFNIEVWPGIKHRIDELEEGLCQ